MIGDINYNNDGRKIFAKRVSFRENVYIRQWNDDDDVNVFFFSLLFTRNCVMFLQ